MSPYSPCLLKPIGNRAWRLIVDPWGEELKLNEAVVDEPANDEQNRHLHRTVRNITRDLEQLSFNTAIARMMEFVNFFTKLDRRPKAALETFVLLLSPFAPHIAEELWEVLGHTKTLAYEPWPTADEKYLHDATIELAVQVLGKVRGKIVVPVGTPEEAVIAAAKEDEKVAAQLSGKTIVKAIVVPGRLVNFVVK